MKLFDKKVSLTLDFTLNTDRQEFQDNANKGKMSISGVQEKYSAVIEKGKIRLALKNEQGTYILKPIPDNYAIMNRNMMPINEYLTMQIAHNFYGIDIAPCGLCYDSEGTPVYITRRFDVLPDGTKFRQEDFASILGRVKTNDLSFKYDGSYYDIAVAIKSIFPSWVWAVESFFNLVIFNYLYANGDAHLKNFSIMSIDGEYVLTPAYDLLNTQLHVQDGDFALSNELSTSMMKSDVWINTGHPCRRDFENFGCLIGIKPNRVQKILSKYDVIPEGIYNMIDGSALSDKMKRQYKRVVEERFHRFVRVSE